MADTVAKVAAKSLNFFDTAADRKAAVELVKPDKIPPSMAFWTTNGHVKVKVIGEYPPNYDPKFHGSYNPARFYNFRRLLIKVKL